MLAQKPSNQIQQFYCQKLSLFHKPDPAQYKIRYPCRWDLKYHRCQNHYLKDLCQPEFQQYQTNHHYQNHSEGQQDQYHKHQ